jgi:hypothetical protein
MEWKFPFHVTKTSGNPINEQVVPEATVIALLTVSVVPFTLVTVM